MSLTTQAHGAEYYGRKVGNIGDIGTFSFYPGKNLGAYGNGGAIVTNDEELSIKCRMIANHGRIEKYSHQFEGRNSRFDAIQAALLNVKLRHLDSWVEHRNMLAKGYIALLSNCNNVKVPVIREQVRHAFHLFVIRTGEREQMIEYLSNHKVEAGIHYPISLPRLQAYSHLGMEDADFQASKIDDEVLSLPIGEHLDSNDVENICELIKNMFYRSN